MKARILGTRSRLIILVHCPYRGPSSTETAVSVDRSDGPVQIAFYSINLTWSCHCNGITKIVWPDLINETPYRSQDVDRWRFRVSGRGGLEQLLLPI